MKTMLAAVLHDFNDLRLEEIPLPEPKEQNTVVVRIKSCGICATDYKATGYPPQREFPLSLDTNRVGLSQPSDPGSHFYGDEVICQPRILCYCEHCRAGNTHYCVNAFTTGGDGPKDVWPGAFAEYMLTKEQCLFKKPPALSFDAACLTEPLSGAWKGLIYSSQMQLGDDTVVIGTGSIGLMGVMVAKAAGAGTLIAIDTSPYARAQALALGATHAIDPSQEEPSSAPTRSYPMDRISS
jgi:threonine dehydrogenase-like Zn-dependent dehydrogenase